MKIEFKGNFLNLIIMIEEPIHQKLKYGIRDTVSFTNKCIEPLIQGMEVCDSKNVIVF